MPYAVPSIKKTMCPCRVQRMRGTCCRRCRVEEVVFCTGVGTPAGLEDGVWRVRVRVSEFANRENRRPRG